MIGVSFILIVLGSLFPFGLATNSPKSERLECISPESKAVLDQLKGPEIYGGLTILRAQNVTNGLTNPLETYYWEDTVFINWKIIPEKVHELEDVLGIPRDAIKPISILRQEHPRYYLSYAIKKVKVPTVGGPDIIADNFYNDDTIQGDWLLYAKTDDDQEPTLLVIGSDYDFSTVSPTGDIAKSNMKFEVSEDEIIIDVVNEAMDTEVVATIPRLKDTQGLDHSFLEAFDKLLFPNGVYSKLTSNGSLLRSQVEVTPRRKFISRPGQDIPWSKYIRQNPINALYFPKTIELAAEVWVNVDDPQLPLGDKDRFRIRESKKAIYGPRAISEAYQLIFQKGTSDPIVKFVVTQDAPAYFINWRIKHDMRDALASFIPLPKGLELAKVRFRENGPKEFVLTLNVYAVSGIVSGFKADWSIFVKEHGSDQPFFLVVETLGNGPSLDPVRLFSLTGAERFEHGVNGDGQVTTTIEDGDTSFSLSFPMPSRCRTSERSAVCDMADLSLITANDKIYYSNGIYDLGRWDGNAWRAYPLSIVNPSSVVVSDGTIWKQFIEDEVLELVVFFEEQIFHLTPWPNLEEVPVCVPPS